MTQAQVTLALNHNTVFSPAELPTPIVTGAWAGQLESFSVVVVVGGVQCIHSFNNYLPSTMGGVGKREINMAEKFPRS